MIRLISTAIVAIAMATPASAHSFMPEGGFYDRFIEGTLVVFYYPSTLLPLVALGLLASLWHVEGFTRAWPALILGQIVGVFVASVVGPWVVPALMAAGALTAMLAALLHTHSGIVVRFAALLVGVLAIAATLEGHALFEQPVAIYIGILFAANLAVAIPAALTLEVLARYSRAWVRILWRVVASWIAAILILYFAVTVVGPAG
jgi:hypothetical protein